ncbi:MAG: alpha/beta hydrolase [Magnetococcales bacterium]|nr:alpha/beta hydrolase [Magnetococcales bacterium]MBF0322382.1 alpha/beta hydrolase [Magnetococcales bacterium]
MTGVPTAANRDHRVGGGCAVAWGGIKAMLLAMAGGCFFSAACSFMPLERATEVARMGGMLPFPLEVRGFRLTTFLKQGSSAPDPLVLYLEGDGMAWLDKHTPAHDPTPRHATFLQLAAADSSPDVLYMARLCQYAGRRSPGCRVRHWTTHRYAEEVVNIHDEALDQVKRVTQARSLALVGYSGGGALTALLAARRQDVVWLVTVAANLDLDAWTNHHGVSPMPDSLNPVAFVGRLQNLPQWHFVGDGDQEVPESVVRSFTARFPPGAPVHLRVLKGVDHACCWMDPVLREIREKR